MPHPLPGIPPADPAGATVRHFTESLSGHAGLDFGGNFGATKTAPHSNPFVGFSVRF